MFAPSFLLKGINPAKIREEYRKGLFNKTAEELLKDLAKITLVDRREIIDSVQCDNVDAGTYCVRDKAGGTAVYATSNYEAYKLYDLSGSLETGGRCLTCTRDIKGNPIGYPMHETQHVEVVDNRARLFTIFWTRGRFDTCRCMKRYVRIMKQLGDPIFMNTDRHLKRLLQFMYPGERIMEANDPELLICNGGSLTDEQWDDGKKYMYKKTDRLILAPVKEEYIRREIIVEPDHVREIKK